MTGDRDGERPAPPGTGFVARDDRERLFVALAELVTRCGHENVTPAAVAGAANLQRGAFERRFASTEECLLAAYEAMTDQSFAAAATAYARAPGGWPESVHAGLAELLAFLGESPALTRLCTVEGLAVGTAAVARRDRAVERFLGLLEPGFQGAVDPRPPTVVAEAVGGGMFELIRGHALEERVAELPDALPEATILVLTPFVGHADAERLAGRPAPARVASG